MRSRMMGVAVTLGLIMLAGQAMAQGNKNQAPSDRSAGAGTGGAVSGINVKNSNTTDPNLNNPTNNPATTDPTLANPNGTGPNPVADPNATGRVDAGARTDQPADQSRRDDRASERRDESHARTDERGRDDIQWRYRYYNGVWWYWMPENRWMYWSNNAWQDYNPSTVQYQYEYDQSGRPVRYRAGYRGPGDETGRTTAKNPTDANRLDANRPATDAAKHETDAAKHDADAAKHDADAKPTGPIDPFKKDADRTDRDSSKSGETRTDDKAKSGSGESSERGDRSKSDDSKRESKSSDSKSESK